MRAAGALLTYLQRQRLLADHSDHNGEQQDMLYFNTIREVPMYATVWIVSGRMR